MLILLVFPFCLFGIIDFGEVDSIEAEIGEKRRVCG
jgi:hypothetical protein